jgi:hypothetical protein
MLIRELLADMRSRLSDDGADVQSYCWSDAELLRHVHAQMRSVATDLADTDDDFYTHEFELFADGATKRHDGVWVYDLPASLHHVVDDGVREWSDEDGERAYGLLREPRRRKATLGRWQVDNDGMLTLFEDEPLDLIVRAAKMPARPFWATLTEDATDQNRVTLPVYTSITAGVHVERDAYVGMRIALASQGAGGDQSSVGEARRVTSSFTVDVAGQPRVEFSLHNPFRAQLRIGAVVESVVQVPDFALEYVTLQAVIGAMTKKNRPVTEALAEHLRVERARYLQSRHRDEAGAKHHSEREVRAFAYGEDPDYHYRD